MSDDEDEDDTVRDDTSARDSSRTQEMTTVPRSKTVQGSPLSIPTERTQLASPAERAHAHRASGADLRPLPTKSIALVVIGTVVVACLFAFLMTRGEAEVAEDTAEPGASKPEATAGKGTGDFRAAAPETVAPSATMAGGVETADPELGVKALNDNCFLHYKANKLDLAEQECKLALSKQPDNPQRGAIYYNLGVIAEKRGDKAGARAFFDQSLEARPKGPGAALVRNAIKELEKKN